MPTFALTDDEHVAVTVAIWGAIDEDRLPRAPRLDSLRPAMAKLDPKAPQPVQGSKRARR
jgi:hypothetical protein